MNRFLYFLLALMAMNGHAATYYIDPVNGADANNGLGPDASDVSNKPFQTIRKFALTNATGGDIGYFAPGVYREAITLSSNWASTVTFTGDPQNSQGFKDGSGVLVPPAICRWTGYTNSDSTPSSVTDTLNCNGKDNFRLENFYILANQASTARAIKAGLLASTNVTISNCVVVASRSYAIDMAGDASAPLKFYADNCVFAALTDGGQAVSVAFTAGGAADWDIECVFRNCLIWTVGNAALGTAKFGTTGFVAGGVNITNCTLIGATYGVSASGSSTSTLPIIVRNSILIGGSRAINAQAVGQVDENYNMNISGGSAAFNNVSLGANSHTNDWSYHLDMAISQLTGFGPRPLLSPLSSSPVVGAGENALGNDFFRKARPAGNALGAYEVHTAPEHSSVNQ